MPQNKWETLWVNGTIVQCVEGFDLIENGGIAFADGKIAWVGKTDELSGPVEELADSVADLEGCCVTPGFIDCHTHVIYGGNRVNEFEARLSGISYELLAKQGGGIQSTVAATREASAEELLSSALQRTVQLMQTGVTTIEIKSGYGLNWETEEKMLHVARQIHEYLPVDVYPTFLAAHTLPPEYKDNADNYIQLVCDEMIPMVAKQGLANAVDVFCEKIAFNLEQTQQVFDAAEKHNLAIKCHAEQLSNLGGAELAAQYYALSADHLEYLTESGIEVMKESGTVAVLLPGAYYFLRETKQPPIARLRQHQIPIAIASDSNPGSSPVASLLLMLSMACQFFYLTPEEALLGVTINAANALGMSDTHGSLEVNKVADVAVWDVTHPAELAYYIGANPLIKLMKRGETVEF